jgi:hypothetical protein
MNMTPTMLGRQPLHLWRRLPYRSTLRNVRIINLLRTGSTSNGPSPWLWLFLHILYREQVLLTSLALPIPVSTSQILKLLETQTRLKTLEIAIPSDPPQDLFDMALIASLNSQRATLRLSLAELARLAVWISDDPHDYGTSINLAALLTEEPPNFTHLTTRYRYRGSNPVRDVLTDNIACTSPWTPTVVIKAAQELGA